MQEKSIAGAQTQAACRQQLPRAVGMVCTWLAYIFSGVALLFYAIG